MCLDIRKRWSLKWPGIGYKIFYKERNGKYTSAFASSKKEYSMDEIVTDDAENMLSFNDDTGEYRTGFHLYKRFKTAVNSMSSNYRFKVIKVKYSGVTAVGKQGGCVAIVARTMRLVEEMDTCV